MKKPVLILTATFLALFAVIALFKVRPELPETARTEASNASEAGQRQHRFWQRYRQATDLRLNGHLADAAEAYQEALMMNPDHEDALYYLGNVHLDLGDFQSAGAAWKRLVTINPNSSRAYAQLGNLAFCQTPDSLFNIDAAEAAYQRAMALNKEESSPVLRLGQLALVRGDLDKARGYFDAVTGSNFKSVEAYFLNSYIAWQQRRPDEALSLFTQSVRHARPQEAPPDFSGEGDTGKGTTTLMNRTSHCEFFEPFIQYLNHLSEPVQEADLKEPFEDLHKLLEQRRSLKVGT